MARIKDLFTLDLFDIPQPAPQTPGSMNYAGEIAHVMSKALKECDFDRYEIVARMSRLLGREISLNMLNAYTAESRETHVPRMDVAVAFDAATEGFALASFHASKLGARLLVGEEALLAELGRIDQMKTDLVKQEKAIKTYLLERKK